LPRSVPEWIGKTDDSRIPIKVLLRVAERQGNVCGCGCNTPINFNFDQLDGDHIVPLKDDGQNRESNVQVLLRRHHVTKTSAENIARFEAERHRARAFNRDERPKMRGAGFRAAAPQRRASTQINKWFGWKGDTNV